MDAKEVRELRQLIAETRNQLSDLSRSMEGRLNYQANEITRLENNVESAVTTVIHELIDYLRHDDIKSLDEAEFAARLRELLRKEPDLPF